MIRAIGGAAHRQGSETSRSILVIDDNREAAELMRRLLRLMGHKVTTAYRGWAALEEADEQRPQLVVIDLAMPGMDGFEIATRLRESPKTRNATLVAVSGWLNSDCRQRAFEAGFDHFIPKPVDVDVLRSLVN